MKVSSDVFDLVGDLRREVVPRGVNQYVDAMVAARLVAHLGAHERGGSPLFVGEMPATKTQAVAFTDTSRSSERFNRCVGSASVARWNAWPFWQATKPNAREIRRGAEYLAQVVEVLKPSAVYCVGRTAERTLGLTHLGVEALYLPHPGQDKWPLFAKKMRVIMEAYT